MKREEVVEWRGGISKRQNLAVVQGQNIQGKKENKGQYKKRTSNLTAANEISESLAAAVFLVHALLCDGWSLIQEHDCVSMILLYLRNNYSDQFKQGSV